MIDPQARLLVDATNASPPLDQLGLDKARAWSAGDRRGCVSIIGPRVVACFRPARLLPADPRMTRSESVRVALAGARMPHPVL